MTDREVWRWIDVGRIVKERMTDFKGFEGHGKAYPAMPRKYKRRSLASD